METKTQSTSYFDPYLLGCAIRKANLKGLELNIKSLIIYLMKLAVTGELELVNFDVNKANFTKKNKIGYYSTQLNELKEIFALKEQSTELHYMTNVLLKNYIHGANS